MALNRNNAIARGLAITLLLVMVALVLVGVYVGSGYMRVPQNASSLTSTTGVVSSATPFQKADILSVIPTSLQPIAVAFDPNNRMVYVSTGNGFPPAIDVISDSSNTIVATIHFPEQNPSVLVFDNSYSNLYAYASGYGDLIYVINPATNQITGNISTGTSGVFGGAIFDPNNQDLYVAGGSTNSVLVISTAIDKVVQTFSIQGNPSFVTYDPTNGYVYVETQNIIVGSEYSNTVTVINGLGNTIVSTVQLQEANGGGICYVSGTGNVYALTTGPSSAVISVISGQTNSLSSSIVLPHNVFFDVSSNMVYDQLNQLMFMTTGNNNVTEFNPATNSFAGGLQLPAQSDEITVDTANGNIYVTAVAPDEVLELSP